MPAASARCALDLGHVPMGRRRLLALPAPSQMEHCIARSGSSAPHALESRSSTQTGAWSLGYSRPRCSASTPEAGRRLPRPGLSSRKSIRNPALGSRKPCSALQSCRYGQHQTFASTLRTICEARLPRFECSVARGWPRSPQKRRIAPENWVKAKPASGAVRLFKAWLV
jgi:hypothetical protein